MAGTQPILIGLSGPSCSGKNTASSILEEYGFYCIDADAVSRRVFVEYENEIFNLFQAEAEKRGIDLKTEKGIDKKAFALLVFSDEALLKKQEDFILPIIEEKIREEIKKAFAERPERPILLNAPTLHKTKLIKECRFILYIDAPFILRFIRAKKRDRLPLKNIRLRFSKQKKFFSQYFFLNADTIVVKNSWSPASLKRKLLHEIKKRGF
ncbi:MULTISPECIES: dephospho-CoA kinase [unclassified Treponema]|uniref:dephospho-CoA kinase n=1 Tax=unclassified Treponema TaxID=2638727 RepID=UPI0020A5E128|nr:MULTISPECIES: dephospho-CoA kinase [unclassified Treponema]UTC68015.1 dephospho-CoA kinase [Treponema sp. OMZ 789]UTC70737.1 dephospho-CoA kinase [Treponema sp. OMZ 790]UTC73457.1 dephospho-CoA kinase [Treponema sp. OMZ 791]